MKRMVRAVTYRELVVKRQRHRSTACLSLRLEVPAEIEEVPVAALVLAATGYHEDHTETRFMVHRDRFYRPVVNHRSGKKVGPADHEAYFSCQIDRVVPPFSAVKRPHPATNLPVPAHCLPGDDGLPIDVKTVISDNSEARAAETQAEINRNMLLVDGEVWCSHPEPVWKIVVDAAKSVPIWMLLSTEELSGYDQSLLFRLDRRREAAGFAGQLAKASGRRFEPYSALRDIQVNSPCLGRNDRQQCLLEMAQRMVKMTADGWLSLLPRSAIEQWADLRSDLEAARLSPAEYLCEQVSGRVAHLLHALEHLELNEYGAKQRRTAVGGLNPVFMRWQREGGSLQVKKLNEAEEKALGLFAV